MNALPPCGTSAPRRLTTMHCLGGGLSNRAWCAQGVLNILDGFIDEQLTEASPPIYLPNDGELMAARGAIVSYIDSIANGNLEPRTEVLDAIVKAVVLSLRWRPNG